MILFNFVSIKSGGGQQNALSFLESIKHENIIFDYIVACTKNSLIHSYCKSNDILNYVISDTKLARLKFELVGYRDISKEYKIKTIFTIFGAAPLISSNTYKISGCAYSNIFQPEIDIWGYLPWNKRIIKNAIDFFRVLALKQSHEIILETEFLKERALKGFLKNKKISVIEMAPSKLITDNLSNVKLVDLDKDCYSLLCLSGAQPNKRIDKFLDVLSLLNMNSTKKFVLKITMDEDSLYFREVLKPKIISLNLEEYVTNLGTIQPSKVSKVIESVDCLVNVALIESFSNNWVEAWASKRLLITTDAEWAKASCESAALYIDVLDAESSVLAIQNIFNNPYIFASHIENGTKLLKRMPSSKMRTQQYLSLLNNSLKVSG